WGSSPGSAERLRTALAHAVEPLGEGEVGEDADVAEAPHGGRGVDVAAEAGLVHQAEDGLERRLAPVGALEAVGAGVEERDGGDGEALAPVAEHLGDGAEAAGEVVEGEVVAAAGAEEGEDEEAVEVVL